MEPFDLIRPNHWRGGLIVASPHSGRDYPAVFAREAGLPEAVLRSSEDAHVDVLARQALAAGAVVLLARVPRIVVDLNRGRSEIDPLTVEGARPCPDNPRAASGLGVIPRVVARGRPILHRPLTAAAAEARLDAFWQPYHDALAALMTEAAGRFGEALLLDMHSMPRDALDRVHPRPEIVLGDRHGHSAAPHLAAGVAGALRAEGFALRRNTPFAGAHILATYGRPTHRWNALQIEVDRSLYMNEESLVPHAGLGALAARFARVYEGVQALMAGAPPSLAAE